MQILINSLYRTTAAIILSILIVSPALAAVPVRDASVSVMDASIQIPVSDQRGDETVTTDDTYSLDPNGQVSVSNLNGSIKVIGWDKPEIRLITKKSARTKAALEEANVSVDSNQSSFTVRVQYNFKNKGRKWNWQNGLSVNLSLMVPRTALVDSVESTNGSVRIEGLRNLTVVSAVNGTVSGTDLSGKVKLETVNGSVKATMTSFNQSSEVRLSTVNGSARVYLPSSIDAIIKADSVNGSISNDFGIPVKKGKYVGRDLYAKVGTGGARIRLTSVNGSIGINRLQDGGTTNKVKNLLPLKNSADFDESFDRNISISINKERKRQREILAERSKAKQAAKEDIEVAIENAAEVSKITAQAMTKVAEALALDNLEITQQDIDRELKAITREVGSRSTQFIVEDSNEFHVEDNPEVSIDAKGTNVSVRTWDKAKVMYRLSRVAQNNSEPVKRITTSSDKNVFRLSVKAIDTARNSNVEDVMLEVFVPKKSRLTVDTNRSIRVEGVQGALNLTSKTGQIDVRDSKGTAVIDNRTGMIRVIGFEGIMKTSARTGNQYLEGDFESIDSTSITGKVYLAIPAGSGATISSNSFDLKQKGSLISTSGNEMTIESGGLTLRKASGNAWKVGDGSRKYNFKFRTGSLVLRSIDAIGRD